MSWKSLFQIFCNVQALEDWLAIVVQAWNCSVRIDVSGVPLWLLRAQIDVDVVDRRILLNCRPPGAMTERADTVVEEL